MKLKTPLFAWGAVELDDGRMGAAFAEATLTPSGTKDTELWFKIRVEAAAACGFPRWWP